MKSILTICQEVADLAAVKRPESLFASTSMSDNIFLSVAKSTLDSLLRYGDWPELTKEGVLQTDPCCKDYVITDICYDFYSMLPNTIYIKDTNEKVLGSIDPQTWMRSRYFCDDGKLVKFKLQNGKLKFLNLPDYPVRIVFQYRSNNICWKAKTMEEKSVLEADSDIPIFDEYLVKLGILWRWLKRSGLDYAEEYAEYEVELKKKFSTQTITQDIQLDSYCLSSIDKGVSINVKVVH